MKKEGKECAFKECKQRILFTPESMGDEPLWMKKGTAYGYCMKHTILEFSDLMPVINPHPDDEYYHWCMINGELIPLVPKEEKE